MSSFPPPPGFVDPDVARMHQQSPSNPRRGSFQAQEDQQGPPTPSASADRYTPAYARRRSSASGYGEAPPAMYGSSPSQHPPGGLLHPQEALVRHECDMPLAPQTALPPHVQFAAQGHAVSSPIVPTSSQQMVPHSGFQSSEPYQETQRRSSHSSQYGMQPYAQPEEQYLAVAPEESRPPGARRMSSSRSHRSHRSEREPTPERITMGDTLVMMGKWMKDLMPARRE